MSKGTCSIDACGEQVIARGWCRLHYNRWHKTGDPMRGRKVTPVTDRFWAKVDRSGGPDACWPWLGAHSKRSGYGSFSRGTKAEGNVGAHRVSFELHNGPIPDGLVVCHRCDNPPCVNPSHLFLGTSKDNHQDMLSKDRYPHPTHCRRGHPYDEENTRRNDLGHIKGCRACDKWRNDQRKVNRPSA